MLLTQLLFASICKLAENGLMQSGKLFCGQMNLNYFSKTLNVHPLD